MGKRTSIYLSDKLAERVTASGLAPAELMRRGLSAGEPEPLETMLRRVVREELAACGTAQPAEECPHPKARINKGLCGACGTYVGTRG